MLEDLNRRLRDVERDDAAESAIYGRPPRRRAEPHPAAPVRQSGARFACPVCGGFCRDFRPFGLGGRRNARCPACGSLERHRFLWLHLRDRLRLTVRRARVLHVAPEPCIRRALTGNPALRYVSVDRFDTTADRTADLKNLPFAAGAFDFVLCSHVLEHIRDDRAAIREMVRVLTPGGRAVVMVPIDMNLPETYEDPSIDTAAGRHRAFGHPYHVRVCGADYPRRLGESGLDVRTVSSSTLSRHRRRLWRINRTVLFDCVKPSRRPSAE